MADPHTYIDLNAFSEDFKINYTFVSNFRIYDALIPFKNLEVESHNEQTMVRKSNSTFVEILLCVESKFPLLFPSKYEICRKF